MKLSEGDITSNLRLVNSVFFSFSFFLLLYTPPLHRLCATAIFGAVVAQLAMRTCYGELTVYCTVAFLFVIGAFTFTWLLTPAV